MKATFRDIWRNALITLSLLSVCTVISLIFARVFDAAGNVQMVFLLAVMLISRYTDNYFWGIFASIVSVPLVNYMFTYPFYSFNITISGYLLTFLTMLTVSIFVSVLTTRLKQQEALRLEAEKEKLRANLLRGVSHDLRTPLTSIVGATGAVMDNDISPEKQRELMADANADAQWLLRMIENLLAITRISGGSLPLRMDTQVVEDVLVEAVIKFQKHFPDVPVTMEQSEEILLADMDAVLIEQVVLNLLENAVYHGKAAHITVCSGHGNGMVSVSISDDGKGILKDKMNRLFTESLYSSGENADAQKHMGIGLTVCHSIIDAHGGAITAHNQKNSGACFTFTLPEKENDYGDQGSDR